MADSAGSIRGCVKGAAVGIRGPLLLPMEGWREEEQNGFVFRREVYDTEIKSLLALGSFGTTLGAGCKRQGLGWASAI